MEISRYIIVSPGPKRWAPKVKLVSSVKGNMPANAVAIKLNIELPDNIFQKPQLQARIKIEEGDISKPVIDAKVLDNIKEVMSQRLGVEMSINIVKKKK